VSVIYLASLDDGRFLFVDEDFVSYLVGDGSVKHLFCEFGVSVWYFMPVNVVSSLASSLRDFNSSCCVTGLRFYIGEDLVFESNRTIDSIYSYYLVPLDEFLLYHLCVSFEGMLSTSVVWVVCERSSLKYRGGITDSSNITMVADFGFASLLLQGRLKEFI